MLCARLTKKIISNFALSLLVGLACLCMPRYTLAEKAKGGETKAAEPATPENEGNAVNEDSLKPGEAYSCKADIFYHWTPEPPTQPVTSASSGTEKADKNPAPATTATNIPPQTDYYSSVEERGMNKQTIRENILARIPGVKTEALNHCRQSRSAGACKEGKLKSANAHYQLLDFESRRQFLESITRSCEGSAGVCTEASASEVNCGIFRSPDAGIPAAESKPAAPAAAAGGKKGK